MNDRLRQAMGVVLIAAAVLTPTAAAAEVDALVGRIKAVGREGAGNAEAGRAWRELVQGGADALPAILAGFDGADERAVNWLRAAVDAVAERELAAGRPLPADRLEAFVRQTQHAGPARRLAYEWLSRVDPGAPGRLLPGMLQDPSAELRRDAVALVVKEARQHLDKGSKPEATGAYARALVGAVDRDQVDLIAGQLKTLGVPVDLAAKFGFVRQWKVCGPFDHRGGVGFNRVYPPEKGVDLAQPGKGKDDKPLAWIDHTTPDPYGVVDLNKVIGKHMGAVAYAYTVVVAPAERPVQLRAGSNNAVKIFLNGQEVFFREEYHHGMHIDQHVGSGTLKAGRNEILVKVCQNEQTDDWAQLWSFQLRLCDAIGGAVPHTVTFDKPEVKKEGQ